MEIDHQENMQQEDEQPRTKCRGNRKVQRLRRKCRSRGMKGNKIKKVIKKRKKMRHRRKPLNTTDASTVPAEIVTPMPSSMSTMESNGVPSAVTTATTIPKTKKRKRNNISISETRSHQSIPRSISSIFLTQPVTKKIKTKRKCRRTSKPLVKLTDDQINKNYRQAMYLKRSSSILFQMLKQELPYALRDNNEQQFIYDRLSLFDRQYCLDVDLQLQRTLLDTGRQHQTWPDSLFIMAQTKDFRLCQEYLQNYIENLRNQLNQCQRELAEQSRCCPIIQLSLEQINLTLNQFVLNQRHYLSVRNNQDILKFQETIDHGKSFQLLFGENLSQPQKDSVHRLTGLCRQQAEIWQDFVMLETRILCQFLPEDCDHLEYFTASVSHVPLNNNQQAIDFRNQRYKIVREAKRIRLSIAFQAYEMKLKQYEQRYENEFEQLESDLSSSTVKDSVSIANAIKDYLLKEIDQLKRTIYHKLASWRNLLHRNRQRASLSKKTIGVSPEPYLDLSSNPFNKREWNYLSYGSSLIRLNQSAIRPKAQQEAAINNDYRSISDKVHEYLMKPPHHIPRNNPIFKQYSNQLLDHLNHSYCALIPYKDQIVAYQQANIAQSIRRKIKEEKLILRVVDKGNNFYVGSAKHFEEKVQKYFIDTKAFTQLTENPFKDTLHRVTHTLKTMASQKLIKQWQLKRMLPDPITSELAHLYFNPKVHKIGIPVRPIENTIRAPTTKISIFLDEHIRPIFDKKCQTTSIINGTHLIQELQKYINKGLLKPSTLFCTFDIRNLYTMLPQEQSLNILAEFLSAHGYTQVAGINLDTIRELASLVLKENFFAYDKNTYRQTTGGAMGSSFTLTLANVFMWKWQQKLVDRQTSTGEFYGRYVPEKEKQIYWTWSFDRTISRYIDDVFMTWNRPEHELRKLLDNANKWHPNIKLDYQIGKRLPFLDVLLTNENSILSTSIYHKPSAEPNVVPFLSDHPRHVFSNIIQGALTRAVRYSSTYETFDDERRYIKLMLLYNGYPSSFIEQQFRKFFVKYISLSPFLPHITDRTHYRMMRDKILEKESTRQSQISTTIAASVTTTHMNDDPFKQPTVQPMETDSKYHTTTNTNENKLIIHYTHEKRFASLKREIHQIYDDNFNNTPVQSVKMIVGTRNRRDARNDLIRKRPKRALLRNTERQKQQHIATSDTTT